jgi:DNA helicase-2/ATP-dependent DNA helicase PcrA
VGAGHNGLVTAAYLARHGLSTLLIEARSEVGGTAASEIAVLYRINAQSEVYEEALTAAGIPFQVRGGEGFFSRQEIRPALVALQRAADRGAEGDLPSMVRELLEPLGLTAEAPTGAKARERWEALT